MGELVVLLNGERVGVVRQHRGGNLTLTYDQTWRDRPDAYPLSLSMLLVRQDHPDAVVRPYLEGLLPDNTDVLDRWAREFQISPRNPFALLRYMGRDCAGAVQLIPPNELGSLVDEPSAIEWLTETEVAERLRDLVEHHGTGRLAGDRGYFSLAGAQPKTAFVHDGERWGIPSGATPTTHILKPPAQRGLDGFDINEHFCLKLAKKLGLAAAESTVRNFDGEAAIVVARYDRRRLENGQLVRLHQEDTCQSLAVPPRIKYEADGGPGAPALVQLLIDEADDPDADVGAFFDALALNWVIAGTDAHAKNYSFLIGPGSVRLAPLYDLISVLPYPHWISYRRAKLAMRVDREYQVWKIRARHWRGLAERCGLDSDPVMDRVRELVTAIPAAVAQAAAEVREEGLDHEIVDRLEVLIGEHAEACVRVLG
ncbi:MAG: type II toxin-antitoxin system HipA family toxin [Gemmatimonadetes bacterium]|jgi:serine/threonine-protein kinase HipA|nr:type II toxin-antitoxin system HipA family toxin [Gemmatimonadota bacterium]